MTGSPGSDASVWNSVTFSKVAGSDPVRYASKKMWPATDQGYRFYAANVPLSYGAAGTTVSASTATDVVVAYLPGGTFRSVNTLRFEHIFARLGTITLGAGPGCTVSNITVTITPKVSGTYNIRTGNGHADGTGWSGVTAGSAVTVASGLGEYDAGDLWMVPGTYSLNFSFTAHPSGQAARACSVSKEILMRKGAVNDFEFVLTTGVNETYGAVDINNAALVDRFRDVPYFGHGFTYAPGNLKYTGGKWVVTDRWEQDSYGTLFGKVEGSYNHQWQDIAYACDYRHESMPYNSGITQRSSGYFIGPDMNGIVYEDWQLTSTGDYHALWNFQDGSRRPGATVNGVQNQHFCLVRLSDYPIGGESQGLVAMFFPENRVITGPALTYFGAENGGINTLTRAQLNRYVTQGCLVFPASGTRGGQDKWWFPGTRGFYSMRDVAPENDYAANYRFDFGLESNGNVKFVTWDRSGGRTLDYESVRVAHHPVPVPDKVVERQPNTDVYLYRNFSPNGAKWLVYLLDFDCSKGDYIEMKVDLRGCYENYENIFSIGRNIDRWNPYMDYNLHVYFPGGNNGSSRVNIRESMCSQDASPEVDYYSGPEWENVTFTYTGMLKILQGTDTGGWCNPDTGNSSWNDMYSSMRTFMSNPRKVIMLGSAEGVHRSHATYEYIKVHFGSE